MGVILGLDTRTIRSPESHVPQDGDVVQRGHWLGCLFGGLIRSAMPLIKRGAVALGKGALKTGLRIADDVMSGQNLNTAAKRRATDTGKYLIRGLLTTPGVRPQKRIKRTPRRASAVKRHRKAQTIRERDVFDDGFRAFLSRRASKTHNGWNTNRWPPSSRVVP